MCSRWGANLCSYEGRILNKLKWAVLLSTVRKFLKIFVSRGRGGGGVGWVRAMGHGPPWFHTTHNMAPPMNIKGNTKAEIVKFYPFSNGLIIQKMFGTTKDHFKYYRIME